MPKKIVIKSFCSHLRNDTPWYCSFGFACSVLRIKGCNYGQANFRKNSNNLLGKVIGYFG